MTRDPPRHWRRWTDREERVVRRLYGTVPLGELAQRLGRTSVAVAMRAHYLGLLIGHHKGIDWDAVDFSRPIKAIARELGVDRKTVQRAARVRGWQPKQ
jgi:hypothetical protein